MVLSGIGQAVQEKVNGQQENTPHGRARALLSSCSYLLASAGVVECECRNTQCNHQHNTVLVQGVSLAEDGEVQDHNGEELAGLGKNECQVVDMGKTGVTEGRGEGRGDADKDQREEYTASGKDRGNALAFRCREEEVCEACNGGERGLDRIQDQREGKSLRRRLRFSSTGSAHWITSRRDAFLENAPRET